MYEAFEKDLFTVCMPIIFCVFESSSVNNHVYKLFQPHCQKHVNIQFQNAHDG